jgi:hypothetical protein
MEMSLTVEAAALPKQLTYFESRRCGILISPED